VCFTLFKLLLHRPIVCLRSSYISRCVFLMLKLAIISTNQHCVPPQTNFRLRPSPMSGLLAIFYCWLRYCMTVFYCSCILCIIQCARCTICWHIFIYVSLTFDRLHVVIVNQLLCIYVLVFCTPY